MEEEGIAAEAAEVKSGRGFLAAFGARTGAGAGTRARPRRSSLHADRNRRVDGGPCSRRGGRMILLLPGRLTLRPRGDCRGDCTRPSAIGGSAFAAAPAGFGARGPGFTRMAPAPMGAKLLRLRANMFLETRAGAERTPTQLQRHCLK